MNARNAKKFGLVAIFLLMLVGLKIFRTDMEAILGIAVLFLVTAAISSLAILVHAYRADHISAQSVPKTLMAGIVLSSVFLLAPLTEYYGIWMTTSFILISFLFLAIWSFIAGHRRAKKSFSDRLFHAVFPDKMVPLIRSELGLIWLALFRWRRKVPEATASRFRSANNLGPIFLTLAVFCVIEAIPVHFIFRDWIPVLANILIGISAFYFIYMIGLTKSLYYFPSEISEDILMLKLGSLQSENIDITNIKNIHSGWPSDKTKSNSINITFLSSPNTVIELYDPEMISGLFGVKKNARYIGFRFDNAAAFSTAMQTRIGPRTAVASS